MHVNSLTSRLHTSWMSSSIHRSSQAIQVGACVVIGIVRCSTVSMANLYRTTRLASVPMLVKTRPPPTVSNNAGSCFALCGSQCVCNASDQHCCIIIILSAVTDILDFSPQNPQCCVYHHVHHRLIK